MIKSNFKYFPKRWMMNKNEYKFYKILISFLDFRYVVIPQVHLDDLVNIENKNKKDRLYSLRHINQKSVDFVICVKNSMHPLLAIELDGYSHEEKIVIEQDKEKERILNEAGIKLKRFENNNINLIYIKKEIEDILKFV